MAEINKKVYCKNCKFSVIKSFLIKPRCFRHKKNTPDYIYGGYVSNYYTCDENKYGDCLYYEPKWWRKLLWSK